MLLSRQAAVHGLSAAATRTSRRLAPRLSHAASPSSTASSDCFALETMSEDGQGWVWDELGQKLVGLAHRTPRASCRTTQLLSYKGDLCEGTKSKRCGRLDLDLGWEATCRNAPDSRFTGKAKVTLESNESHKDSVDVVAVELDPACLAALPAPQPGERDKVVADVVYAVESLDTAIMEQLNDFLWSMEQRNALEHDSHGDSGADAPALGRA